MKTHKQAFRPKETFLVGGEIELLYDCDNPPQSDVEAQVKLRSFRSWGFILVHQYEIESARIIRVEPQEGSVTGCRKARSYTVTLHYFMRSKLRLSLSKLSREPQDWESLPWDDTIELTMESVCCDPDYVEPARRVKPQPLHGNIPVLPLMAGPGGLFGSIQGYSLTETGVLVLLSLPVLVYTILVLRLYWRVVSRGWNKLFGGSSRKAGA